jgi:hypothetical protein
MHSLYRALKPETVASFSGEQGLSALWLTHDNSTDTFQEQPCGGLAQLGERLAGSQKVSGSSPLSSTYYAGFQAPFRWGFFMRRLCLLLLFGGNCTCAVGCRGWYSAKQAALAAKYG